MNPVQTPHTTPRTESKLIGIELFISHLLRLGVLVSLMLIVAGTVITYIHHPAYIHSRTVLSKLAQPREELPHTLREVATGVANLRGQAIVMTGLLLLIVTPIVRVFALVLAFFYQGDPLFSVIGSIVLLLLLLSFFLGKLE